MPQFAAASSSPARPRRDARACRRAPRPQDAIGRPQECADADLDPTADNLGRIRAAIALPAQPDPRRERPAARCARPAAAQGRRRPLARHGRRRLLRAHHAEGVTMVDRILARPLRPRGPGLDARREPRLGHRLARHAPRRRRGLDGLARPPREHPQARLPRHGRRRRARRAGLGRRRARRTRWTSGSGASLVGAVWPTSSPSAPSTTTSTASAASRPSSPRRTTSSTPSSARELLARSPHNVVEIDLPQGEAIRTRTPPRCSARGSSDGVLVRDEQPALWALEQDYTGPDGRAARATASSRACASRTTAPAASARTSARTRARRRTGCGSRARRTRTSPPSSPSTTTRPARRGARSRPHLEASRGPR